MSDLIRELYDDRVINPGLGRTAKGLVNRAKDRVYRSLGLRTDDNISAGAGDIYPIHAGEIDTPDESITVPSGQTEAVYLSRGRDDAIVFDEASIPGTRKNSSYRRVYRAAMDLMDRVSRKYTGAVRKRAETWKNFYRNILKRLGTYPETTAVHELDHKVKNKIGWTDRVAESIKNYVGHKKGSEIETGAEEGVTELRTEEVTGRDSTIPGTTYEGFKIRAKKALNSIGFNTATQAIRNYIKGDESVPGRFGQAYMEA